MSIAYVDSPTDGYYQRYAYMVVASIAATACNNTTAINTTVVTASNVPDLILPKFEFEERELPWDGREQWPFNRYHCPALSRGFQMGVRRVQERFSPLQSQRSKRRAFCQKLRRA